MAWQEYEGKKVYILINTREGTRRYSGTINEVTFMGKSIEGVETYFLSLTDKFGAIVGFISTQVQLIEEEK